MKIYVLLHSAGEVRVCGAFSTKWGAESQALAAMYRTLDEQGHLNGPHAASEVLQSIEDKDFEDAADKWADYTDETYDVVVLELDDGRTCSGSRRG